MRGVATFEVVVRADGSADVRVDTASAEIDAWTRLSDAMAVAVARKHVRLPEGARGLRVAIRLDAHVQYPDGTDPAARGTFVRATGFEVSDDSMVAKSAPSINAGARGKVCSGAVHVGLDGVALGGNCSPENIGMPAVRVIDGRELSEASL